MIPSDAFSNAKEVARYPFGPSGKNRFVYWSDVGRQWEKSNDSGKLAALIGGQSAPGSKRRDLKAWLGDLSSTENKLGERFLGFYEKLLPVLTSAPVSVDAEIDWLETLVDLRCLGDRLSSQSRVLDIGPGAGRHMVALALSPELRGVSYVGAEAIGLPYALQNLIGALLYRDQAIGSFKEYLDYHFSRQPFDAAEGSVGSFMHLPIWEASRIPEKSIDVVLCCHLLDEVAPDDFMPMIQLIDRVLMPGGVIYARGSQERALLPVRYLYGQGSFHGHDITEALLGIGVVPIESGLITDTLTRVFSRTRAGGPTPTIATSHAGFASDPPFIEALQKQFLADAVAELTATNKRVMIWGDPGYSLFLSEFAEHRERLNVIGLTNRFAVAPATTALGYTEYPVSEIARLEVDAVIFASPRLNSYLRELRETAGTPGEFSRVRHFCHPFAVAFRT